MDFFRNRWNSERLDLDGFKKFVQEWRTRYTFLDFEFHEALATPDVNDEEGRGGTIGFALKGRVVSKDDGKMYGGKAHAIELKFMFTLRRAEFEKD
ncbi:similar to An11g08960 [Aspergillus luchuensis]|uniref:Similar to An11g08960 n=1 Tax=Aspergillus kawachii TaxID=1069201 RepID=A0A146FQY8_ASPKA|nr:similar to An11g08960 [Aspergillus luchuensis]